MVTSTYTEKSEKETEFLCQMVQQWRFLHAPATSVSQINFSTVDYFSSTQLCGKITPLRFNREYRLTFFVRISCWSVPLQRNASSLYQLQRLPTFSPSFCAPLAQDAKILTPEIWVRRTYDCTILSRSVKACRSYLRKTDFEQILGCHAYARQRIAVSI